MLGKTIYWRFFVDTIDKKKAAEKAVLKDASKKGPEELEKLGIVSLDKELVKKAKEVSRYETEREERERKDQERKESLQKKEEQAPKKIADVQTVTTYPELSISQPDPLQAKVPPLTSKWSQSHLAPPVQKKRKKTLKENVPKCRSPSRSKRTARRHLQDHRDLTSKNDMSAVPQGSQRTSTAKPASLQDARAHAKYRQLQQSLPQPKPGSLQDELAKRKPQQGEHIISKQIASHPSSQPKPQQDSYAQPKQPRKPPEQKYPSIWQAMKHALPTQWKAGLPKDDFPKDEDEDLKSVDDGMEEYHRRRESHQHDSRTSQPRKSADDYEDEDLNSSDVATEEYYHRRGSHHSQAGRIAGHYENEDEDLTSTDDGVEEYHHRRGYPDMKYEGHTSQARQTGGHYASTQHRNSHIYSEHADSGNRVQQAIDERQPGVVYNEPLETPNYNNDEANDNEIDPHAQPSGSTYGK